MSEDINVNAIADTLNGKMDLDMGNLPANIDYVVESKFPTASDPTWYRVYKSGWVEQGGKVTGSFNQNTVFTLQKTMADTNYTITGSATQTNDSNAGVAWGANPSNITTTSFTGKAFYGTTPNIGYSCLMYRVSGMGA